MPKDTFPSLDVLEKPLNFASKDSFKNLSKVKNLEKVVNDITLKLISQVKDQSSKEQLTKIRDRFVNFESKH